MFKIPTIIIRLTKGGQIGEKQEIIKKITRS